MSWWFIRADNNTRNVTDPASLAVMPHGDLTPLQVFVREVLQNSLDNRSALTEAARVDFRLQYLLGAEKQRFLQTLDFKTILPHIQSIVSYEKKNKRYSEFRDPADLHDKDRPLRLLYIEDFGTLGLIGPEHNLEIHRFDKPHCFIGLCRNTGDSQKSQDAMGGIYGLGKTVLWKCSRYRTVLFYSRLRNPYIEEYSSKQHTSRFFGHIRLPSHDIGKEVFYGDAFWGMTPKPPSQTVWSLMSEEADRAAEEFGFTRRGAKDYGTSILVVDFEDPEVEEELPTEEATLRRIKEAAEEYYWPALMLGDLKIRTKASSQQEAVSADPSAVPHLRPFIKAYISARLNRSRDAVELRKIDVNVPRGPNEEPACKSSMAACVILKSEENEEAGKFVNRTALIRGSGMVVGYPKIGRAGFGGKDFFAVVLGGKSCPPDLAGGEADQMRCEQLLAYAEPVTHDIWTRNSERLKRWRGAMSEIGRILDGVKQAINYLTTSDAKPQGRAITLLSTYFPIGHGTETKSVRDTSVRFLSDPLLESDGGGRLRCTFHIRVDIPSKKDFLGWVPDRWKVECRYGFFGEDVKRKVVQSAAVGFTEVKKNGSGWQSIAEFASTFEDQVGEDSLSYELRGITAPLEDFIAKVTTHELQIRVLKS